MDFLSRESSKYQWQLYPLHSTITQEEQQQVFCIPPVFFRKVILSTNIAESSITVPDIKYVIDFCLTKVLCCDIVTNYTSLKLAWTSQASCKQRAGRSGRVSSGRVYRLIPQVFFEKLSAYATPELCRTPLTHIILKTKVLNMGEPHSLLALALDPPKMADIHRTILTLKQMGALAVKSHGQMSILDGDLTYLGRVIANLPVDPHLAKLMVMGYLFGCLRECIIIAAGLSLKSFHAQPFQDELNAFLSKVSWSYGSFSDCFAVLNTYDLWQSMQVRGEFMCPGGKTEKNWAKHSYVQLSILQEVQKLIKELTGRLERLKILVRNRQNPPRHNQSLILKICMAAAFFPHYYKRNVSEEYERETCRELNGHDPFTTVVLGGLPPDTNILYDHQIRQLFKECSQNLIIHYEGSKAYIQFPRLGGSTNKEEHFQDIPGECPTSMYLALKMRQVKRIQQGLVLNLYSPEESKAKMMETLGYSTDPSGSVSILSNTSSEQTLSSTRLRATQPSFCRLKPPILPAPTNHTWRVHVTYVKSAGNFWVVSNEKSAIANLLYIQSSIDQAIMNDQAPLMAQKHIIPGNVCLAKYTDIDGMQAYYRARIEEVYDCHNEAVKAMVFFVDFGNNEVVNTLELRCLPKSIVDMNMLAVECMLAELKPASKSADGTWGSDATAWFQGYTLNKDFTAQIYSVVHGIIRVKLLEMDKGRLISVNAMLISMDFAVKAEEFYLSKQNHELRAIYSSEVEEASAKANIASAFSSLSFNFPSRRSSASGRALLRGPDSPLRMRFVALSRAGGFKSVRIASSSVNSTLLDLEPQNPHDRLLVASSVTLDASESCVTLNNTTLMPSIPGMLPLCLLLFCPIAEMR
ncbi:ATP-dependent RNA helicase TDRD9 [Panulirus ornatus]|uniref:ATP-dependent RNA helicase TDRD9 n=1 Tax=Panulirus ornatus TaxID=150431 RepID=UPI003A8C4034